MRYWRNGNDLYTSDIEPVEGAVEITEEEYLTIYRTRTVTHLPMIDDEEASE